MVGAATPLQLSYGVTTISGVAVVATAATTGPAPDANGDAPKKAPKKDLLSSDPQLSAAVLLLKLELAGAGLRQDVARRNRCATADDNCRKADQAEEHRPGQRDAADIAPFPIDRMDRAPNRPHRQATLLRESQGHDQTCNRDDIRRFLGIFMCADRDPICQHFSYVAAADECWLWGIIAADGPQCDIPETVAGKPAADPGAPDPIAVWLRAVCRQRRCSREKTEPCRASAFATS